MRVKQQTVWRPAGHLQAVFPPVGGALVAPRTGLADGTVQQNETTDRTESPGEGAMYRLWCGRCGRLWRHVTAVETGLGLSRPTTIGIRPVARLLPVDSTPA